ncbi:hypothetical protein C1645_859212 [Glomus cerebriforme]|uniref:Galactose oxidase n=1 Tax=Glomus cerebriforme TaxID=658196 RepID=A0A397TQT9_9GLOM|nr:hypothetical protein C1645_859212 [Glomus cerebriforme]
MVHKNLNRHLAFIILSILIQLLNIVYGQAYIPKPRIGAAAVYIQSEFRLYYIGGYTYNVSDILANPTSDLFYLDCNPYSNTFFTWTDLKSQGVNIPPTVSLTANLEGVNQDSIFIIGGQHILKQSNEDYFYKYDIITNEMSIPVIQGKAPPARGGVNSVSYEGKIYMFGGIAPNADSNIPIFFNNFDILDTVNLNWQVGSTVNSPITRSGYTATLVNGVIYYIGGRTAQYTFSPMSEIYQYDILGDKWSLKTAAFADAQAIPGPRNAHSAVLYNDKIFVYGGAYFNGDTSYELPPKEIIAMLDTTTLVWSIPQINGTTDMPNLVYHTATLMYATMVVSFGNITGMPDNEDRSNKLSYLFYLDLPIQWNPIPTPTNKISNITTETPVATSDTTPLPSSSPNKMVIVGVSVGLVVFIGTIFLVCSLVYRRMNKNKIKTGEGSSQANGQDALNEIRIQSLSGDSVEK